MMANGDLHGGRGENNAGEASAGQERWSEQGAVQRSQKEVLEMKPGRKEISQYTDMPFVFFTTVVKALMAATATAIEGSWARYD